MGVAGDVDAAIKSRWASRGLSASITGGIFADQVKPGETAVFPYCVFGVSGQSPKTWTNKAVYEVRMVQFDIYHTQKATAMDLAELVSDAYLFAPLTLAGGGQLVELRLNSGPIPVRLGDSYKVVLTFHATTRRTITVNPS